MVVSLIFVNYLILIDHRFSKRIFIFIIIIENVFNAD
jgi:hypothetical protein